MDEINNMLKDAKSLSKQIDKTQKAKENIMEMIAKEDQKETGEKLAQETDKKKKKKKKRENRDVGNEDIDPIQKQIDEKLAKSLQ